MTKEDIFYTILAISAIKMHFLHLLQLYKCSKDIPKVEAKSFYKLCSYKKESVYWQSSQDIRQTGLLFIFFWTQEEFNFS